MEYKKEGGWIDVGEWVEVRRRSRSMMDISFVSKGDAGGGVGMGGT